MLQFNKVRPWILIPALVLGSVALGWFGSQYVDLMENDHLEEMNQRLEAQVTDLETRYEVQCAVGSVMLITLADSSFIRGWRGEQQICARDWHISNAVSPQIGPNPEMHSWTPPRPERPEGTSTRLDGAR